MTTITLFKYNKNKWWAFKQMGLHRSHFLNISGLRFYKMLGTGSSPGFSMYPDFSTYALLQTWSTKDDAENYFASNGYFNKMVSNTHNHRIIFMNPFKSSGFWNGENPFTFEHPERANLLLNPVLNSWEYAPKKGVFQPEISYKEYSYNSLIPKKISLIKGIILFSSL